MHHANTNKKNTLVVILITDKMVFKTKNITMDKEHHFITIKD